MISDHFMTGSLDVDVDVWTSASLNFDGHPAFLNQVTVAEGVQFPDAVGQDVLRPVFMQSLCNSIIILRLVSLSLYPS